MDTEIIRELFNGYLEITEENQLPKDLNETINERLNHMPELQIGKYGQIQEWSEDYDEVEPGHRHISQLFALYPAGQIRMDKTPELAQAAKQTIERRLKYGGGHTGWSKAWIILFYARLWEKEEAWKNLKELLEHATLNNLFDNHPPFQIDGNFGGACGLLEMLIQDYSDKVFLLPALPNSLSDGEVNGVCLKAGAVLDMKWKEGNIDKIKITAMRDCKFILVTEKEYPLHLKKDQTVFLDKNFNTVKFDSFRGFACGNQRLHSLTGYSVSRRRCHSCVPTSPSKVVTEY